MKYKRTVKFILLAFVAISVVFLVIQQVRPRNAPVSAAVGPVAAAAPGPVQDATAQGSQKVIAYYFHTTSRCQTCRMIEALAAEAIKQGFAEALRNGSLEFRPVNVQLPENRHFIYDYQLFAKSLVIVRIRDGQQVEWKNLQKVWELVGNKQAFLSYVQEEIRSYLRKQ